MSNQTLKAVKASKAPNGQTKLRRALAKLTVIRSELEKAFYEREAEIRGLLIALIAREHILLLGPPGTAKSALARSTCEAVKGASFFQWLFTKFSVPEEIFGPISLKSLEQDKVERITTGKLPESHISFLDEIFKANSAILNSLLTAANERLFYNGNSKPTEIPLNTIVGASNELPDSDDLGALYDRFLLRFWVSYLYDRADMLALLLSDDAPSAKTKMTISELETLQKAVPKVKLSQAVAENILQIKSTLESEGIIASDRRWRESVKLIKATALLRGSLVVCDDDLDILEHVLWARPDQRAMVREKVAQVSSPLLADAREILDAATESYKDLLKTEGTNDFSSKAVDTIGVLVKCKKRMVKLINDAQTNGQSVTKIEPIRAKIDSLVTKSRAKLDRFLA